MNGVQHLDKHSRYKRVAGLVIIYGFLAGNENFERCQKYTEVYLVKKSHTEACHD